MCLGVPGRVVEWLDRDPTFAKARIEFGGVNRVCCMACVPDAVVGDYVVVHAGIAISRVDDAAAMSTLREIADSGLAEGLEKQHRNPQQAEEDVA